MKFEKKKKKHFVCFVPLLLEYDDDGFKKKNSTLAVKYIWIYKYTLNIKKCKNLSFDLKIKSLKGLGITRVSIYIPMKQDA